MRVMNHLGYHTVALFSEDFGSERRERRKAALEVQRQCVFCLEGARVSRRQTLKRQRAAAPL